MYKKENLQGADISTSICGIPLRTPYILTSGPLSYAAEGMTVDENECRSCGACVSVCPTGALTAFVKPQSEEDAAREQESIAFYAKYK